MQLEHLHIRRKYMYEPGSHQFQGEVKYSNETGAIQITLGGEASSRILAIIADEMVAQSQRVAADLTANIIDTAGLRQLPEVPQPASPLEELPSEFEPLIDSDIPF